MGEKLIFKLPRPVRQNDKPPVVRVTAEAYSAIESISAKTGLSNCYVASQMILYAARNTEVVIQSDGEQ